MAQGTSPQNPANKQTDDHAAALTNKSATFAGVATGIFCLAIFIRLLQPEQSPHSIKGSNPSPNGR